MDGAPARAEGDEGLTLLTARCLDIRALLMYLSAYSALVCLCCTTRTLLSGKRGQRSVDGAGWVEQPSVPCQTLPCLLI